MSEAGKYLVVYVTGAAGIWKGVPLGIALKLPSVMTGLLTALGSITTVLILYFAGDSFRKWILKKYGKKRIEKKQGKFIKLLERFGMPVMGVLAPGLLGPVIPLIMALMLIKDTRNFLIYLVAGITLWSFVLAYLFTPLFDFFSRFL